MFARPAQRAVCALVLVLVTTVFGAGCNSSVFGRQFEYEEEIFLSLDGSVSVVVNASIPALATLRGASLDTAPDARVDRDAVRTFYECPGVEVIRVSRPWTREGRRFIQVRVDADDLHALSRCRAFSWATYGLTREQGTMRYTQRIGSIAPVGATPAAPEPPTDARPAGASPVGGAGAPPAPDTSAPPARIAEAAPDASPARIAEAAPDASPARIAEAAPAAKAWSGTEFVAIRMHLPSRITFHNAPSREVERGNILTWEQPLRNRLAGEPIDIDVRMDERSILRRTMTVFGLAVGAALLLLAAVVWWVKRKGRRA